MAIPALLLLAFMPQTNDVVLTSLDGTKTVGRLESLSAESATVATADGAKDIDVEQLIDIRWKPAKFDAIPVGQVYLLDGSVLTFESLVTASRQVRLKSPIYGDVDLPLSSVRAIRFGKLSDAADAWATLLGRNRSKDVLVLPKKKKLGELDPTTGVVGQIDEKSLKFVLGGDEIPVNRTRIYGVIFARKSVVPSGRLVVEAGVSDRLVADTIEWVPTDARLSVTSGDSVISIDGSFLKRIDCSGGKIRYLDEMKPVFHDFAYVLPDPLYKTVFRYRVNETMDGQPLRLGGKEYDRGLWIHSKTTLRYDLEGAFSRFESIVGIDDDLPRRHKTKARLTIKGDERVLLDQDVWITDKPRALKLNVIDVQTLEIVVDFGETQKDGTPPLHAALQDWVDLADAKVVK